MTADELRAACKVLGWDAETLGAECVMGPRAAEAMLNGTKPVWEDVAELVVSFVKDKQTSAAPT